MDDYYFHNIESLTFDDSEFVSFNESSTLIEGANRSKSETDPNFIDKIPVFDSSDSEIEGEKTQFDRLLESSSPILWSPQKIQCDKVQNLDQALLDLHQNCPELQKPEEGRVYQMDEILEAVNHPNQPRVSARSTRREA